MHRWHKLVDTPFSLLNSSPTLSPACPFCRFSCLSLLCASLFLFPSHLSNHSLSLLFLHHAFWLPFLAQSVSQSVTLSLCLCDERGSFERERGRKKERKRIRGGGWRGGVGPYKSSWLQLPRSQKYRTQTKGGKHTWHPRTSTCTQGTSVGTRTTIQVRTPCRGGGQWRRRR